MEPMRLGERFAKISGLGKIFCCNREPGKASSLSLPNMDLSYHQWLSLQLWDKMGPASTENSRDTKRSWVLNYISKLLD